MKTVCGVAGASLLIIALTACGGYPTAGPAAGAGGPSYDGGFGMGSGNREAPADSTSDPGSTTSSGSTERGGYTMGSGN